MKVLNKRDASASAGVYIGRGSPWGNPFVIGIDGDRAEVIAKFRVWAEQAIGKEWLAPLIGKDLICYCAPQACHGDVLLEMIEGE